MSSDLRQDLGSGAARPGGAVDPVRLARRDLKKALPRRFYKAVTISDIDGGFGVCLDGRPLRTPGKAVLVVPTRALAEALAAEWQRQGDIVEPDSMPMTRLANSAIDGVAVAAEAIVAEMTKFAETDLVCYRAEDPSALVAAQAAAWDSVLDFARDTLDAPFVCTSGVMYVAQPANALTAVAQAVERVARSPAGPFRLAAFSVMTNLTGSVLLALAVAQGEITVEASWSAAHVDEDHQTSLWGCDREAAQRRAHRWRDMQASARFYVLTGS